MATKRHAICCLQLHIVAACVQARETGICPIREELYAQTFDELIRQVTINCAERGLLLLRVRDELRMTIAAYQVRSIAVLLQPCGCAAEIQRSTTKKGLPPGCMQRVQRYSSFIFVEKGQQQYGALAVAYCVACLKRPQSRPSADCQPNQLHRGVGLG